MRCDRRLNVERRALLYTYHFIGRSVSLWLMCINLAHVCWLGKSVIHVYYYVRFDSPIWRYAVLAAVLILFREQL